MVGGYYQRAPEGLTYRGWPVLVRGDRGLVAVIDESATDRAVRLGYEHDAHWDVVDGCGCAVGMIRHLKAEATYEASAYGRGNNLTVRTYSLEAVLGWISDNEAACQHRVGGRHPRLGQIATLSPRRRVVAR